MNALKFRVLGKDNVWRYGEYPDLDTPDITHRHFNMEILWATLYRYRRETLGQGVGAKDKNGEDYFDGDIFKCPDVGTDSGEDIALIFWDNDSLQWYATSENYTDELVGWDLDKSEIIGNKWQNPELLKKHRIVVE